MNQSYYDRTETTFVDGTAIFKSAEDEAHELAVAKVIEGAWRCEVHSFGKLAIVDWFFVRDGRMVGLGELKTRFHASTQFETVFLNFRKWVALTMASNGTGVPAVFVVQFSDGVRWIDTAKVDASRIRIGGCTHVVKSRNDVEPVIEVPVSQMKTLT